MSRLIYILTLILFVNTFSIAQTELVNKAAKSAQEGNYDAAQLSIDQAVLEEINIKSAKAWYYYGFIYKELYKAKELTNPKSPYRNSAIVGLKKSIDVDPSSEFAGDCKTMLNYLITTMYNDAVKALNTQDFKNSFSNYEGYIGAMKIVNPSGIEDKVIFYTGYSAFMISKFDDALVYFNQVKAKDYNDPLLYYFLGKIYHDKGDKAMSLQVLEEGKEKHPAAKDLNDLYINYMLEQGKLTSLENEFKKAINLSPNNLELYVTLALLYEKKAEIDRTNTDVFLKKAADTYREILTKDINHVRANYNLALLFYNKAVNLMKNTDEDDIFALNEIQDECIELFRESLPYFEKAHELDPNNKEVLIGLGGVHFSLNNIDKQEEYKAKLERLEGKQNKK